MKVIHMRYDLVHRTGKAKNGQPLNITKEDVTSLIEEVGSLAGHIEEKGKYDF